MPKHRDTEPWERLEGEGVKAYEAFSVYLELGEERSIRAVAKQLNKSTTLIGRWSRTYQWVERTAAYDVDIQRKAHAQAVKKRRKMANRHISIALKLQEKALQALKDMDENRMELEADTAPGKANEQADSSLAAVISEAWERRKQQNEPDK